MSNSGDFWRAIDERSKANNYAPVLVGQIQSITPLSIQYQGLELSSANGDKIFVNNLLLDEAISFDTAQKITCSNGTITENHTEILNAVTSWLMSVHARFILKSGDYVAIQKLGNNTYIVLEKVQKIE